MNRRSREGMDANGGAGFKAKSEGGPGKGPGV
jgi:hypothetical protein